ncbi:MAG: hypothetical protein ABJP70_02940 [Erythrobacter sp.]
MSTSERNFAIWAAGLALAILSGAGAVGGYAHKRNPPLAVIASPGNGLAKAQMADAVLKAAILENKGEIPKAIPDLATAYAREAFLKEPLAAEAPRILALSRVSEDGEGTASARALMRLIPAISKRETSATLWLSDDYAKLKDDAQALYFLDLTLRASSRSKELLLPMMVNIADREEAIAPLTRALDRNPPWLAEFWAEAVKQVPRAKAIAKLRESSEPPESVRADVDRRLLDNLVQQGAFAEAADLTSFLAGAQRSASFTSPFETFPKYPPFDWELVSEGGYGAFIDGENTMLLMSAMSGERGVAARRILPLEAGRYTLTLKDVELSSDSVILKAQTRCPDDSAQVVHDLKQSGDNLRAEWQVAGVPCDYYWLEIMIDVPSDDQPVDVRIDSMTLSKN